MQAVAAARVLLGVLAVYGAAGIATAVPFALFGVRRALAGAGKVTLGARLLLVPAAVALWPIVLWRWIRPMRRA